MKFLGVFGRRRITRDQRIAQTELKRLINEARGGNVEPLKDWNSFVYRSGYTPEELREKFPWLLRLVANAHPDKEEREKMLKKAARIEKE